MRVIAGTARHLLLKTPEGLDTRPTTDRIKETLFNILQPYLPQATFLDLFSGSGGMGIEALSRGASYSVFAEKDPRALACIRENLKHTGFEGKSRVYACDVLHALAQIQATGQKFDFVFLDPPYNQDWERQILACLQDGRVLEPDAWIIVEASLKTDLSYAEELGFQIFRQKQYKTNQHIFLKRIGK